MNAKIWIIRDKVVPAGLFGLVVIEEEKLLVVSGVSIIDIGFLNRYLALQDYKRAGDAFHSPLSSSNSLGVCARNLPGRATDD